MSRQMRSVNPATGELLRAFDLHSDAEIESRLDRAARAFQNHRHLTFSERAKLMRRVADILESEKNEHARTITLEMGKPIQAAVQEVEKCALCCRFYADNAERFLSDEQIETRPTQSFIRFQPIGAVLAVMP